MLKSNFFYFLSLVFFVFFFSVNQGAAQETTTFRAMSFHIRSAEGSDGKVNLNRIAAIIKQGNPDLVALQGVDRGTKHTNRTDQARLLAADLKMNYVFAKTQDEDGGETGNAILSRFPIGQHKALQLPKTSPNNRVILVALIKIGKSKKAKEIRFVSTALGGGNSGQIRQIEKLNEYFFIEGEETPVLMGAHLYSTLENSSVVEMRKEWTDAFDAIPESTDRDEKLEGPVEKRINYIFFRSKDPFQVRERRIWADPLLAYPPVLVEVSL